MAINPDDRIIFRVNPYLAFEKIFVSPFGNRLRNEAVVTFHQLLTEQVHSVVCPGDSAIVMLLTRRGFDLTGDNALSAKRRTRTDPFSDVTANFFWSGARYTICPTSWACTFPFRSTT